MPARRHGDCNSAEYHTWENMWSRVRNPRRYGAHRYIGRGIRVCERWQQFENFLSDMGRKPAPELTLERVDNDGDYHPANCCWASRKQQRNNLEDGGRRAAVRRYWRNYRERHSKPCIICGTMFFASHPKKYSTCSPECRSERCRRMIKERMKKASLMNGNRI